MWCTNLFKTPFFYFDEPHGCEEIARGKRFAENLESSPGGIVLETNLRAYETLLFFSVSHRPPGMFMNFVSRNLTQFQRPASKIFLIGLWNIRKAYIII